MPTLKGFLVVSLEHADNGGGPVTRCQRGVPSGGLVRRPHPAQVLQTGELSAS